jgi:phage baseplate assembly protein W
VTASNFLGQGWNFPVTIDREDQIAPSASEASIVQAIWIILGTAKGERVMRPDFGCGIHDLVFAGNTPATAAQVAAEVKRSLLAWEPRIDVLDVRTESEPGQPQTLLVQIRYLVRRTNSAFNMVYPFFLEARPA